MPSLLSMDQTNRLMYISHDFWYEDCTTNFNSDYNCKTELGCGSFQPNILSVALGENKCLGKGRGTKRVVFPWLKLHSCQQVRDYTVQTQLSRRIKYPITSCISCIFKHDGCKHALHQTFSMHLKLEHTASQQLQKVMAITCYRIIPPLLHSLVISLRKTVSW